MNHVLLVVLAIIWLAMMTGAVTVLAAKLSSLEKKLARLRQALLFLADHSSPSKATTKS